MRSAARRKTAHDYKGGLLFPSKQLCCTVIVACDHGITCFGGALHANHALPRRLRCHFADGMIAKRIVELAKAGERNPGLLCEGALKELRGHLFGD